MAKKLYYKIGEACKMLDIQPYVLRYWETEFPALNPTKSKSGQRVYGKTDLAVIQRIKELLYDEGYTIAGAKKKLEGEDLSAAETEPAAPAKTRKPKAPKPKAKTPESGGGGKTAKASAESKTPAAASSSNADSRLAAGLRKALEEVREIQTLLDRDA